MSERTVRPRDRFDDAHEFHMRAEEMRTVGEGMTEENCRQMCMRIADDYERMARQAEQRADNSKATDQ
jgi:hypothetical protein